MKKSNLTLMLASLIMFTSTSCVVFVPSKRRHRKVVVVSSVQTLKHTPATHVSLISHQPTVVINN